MGLDIKNALSTELRVTGTQKGGRYIRRRRFYTFTCIDCPSTFTPQRTDLSTLSGRCRDCANKHGAGITGMKIRKRPYEALYNRFIYDRRRAFQTTDIMFDDFVAFTKISNCHYCGSAVQWAKYSLARNGYCYNLDRKDNRLGYLNDNVVVCCWRCNETKSDRFTYEQFVQLGNVIRTFKGGTCGA